MQRFRVDLKTFLGLAMPITNASMLSESIIGRFLGGIFGQETPNLIVPYNIVLPYYMISEHQVNTKQKVIKNTHTS